ncbi:MAG: hypothetical protein ACT4O1_15965, partial [Gemmatimonadota bacterium]
GVLTLKAAARFAGVIVARDGLRLDDDATVHGSIRSTQGATLLSEARVSYSRCVITRTLSATKAARRKILQPRTFIQDF